MVNEVPPIQPFKTVVYTTANGENCSATKNGNVVTITGDQNGIRQMPIDKFVSEELPKVNLERTPGQDTFNKQ
ncbi:MAG: hypothetical protein LBK53_04655 [Heliobacteriaceae bacterium]|jgi:hypothetical protein|nr:hypothetical protein [Heliobacteriaceae bacterium]